VQLPGTTGWCGDQLLGLPLVFQKPKEYSVSENGCCISRWPNCSDEQSIHDSYLGRYLTGKWAMGEANGHRTTTKPAYLHSPPSACCWNGKEQLPAWRMLTMQIGRPYRPTLSSTRYDLTMYPTLVDHSPHLAFLSSLHTRPPWNNCAPRWSD